MRTQKGNLCAQPLADVLADLCRERGLSLAQVVSLAEPWCDRATAYRVMAGKTREPLCSTLAALCRAMDVRPQDVFERAGLWNAAIGPKDGSPASSQQAQLRRVWNSVALLPDGERMRITQVVRAMVEAAHAQREGERTTHQIPARSAR